MLFKGLVAALAFMAGAVNAQFTWTFPWGTAGSGGGQSASTAASSPPAAAASSGAGQLQSGAGAVTSGTAGTTTTTWDCCKPACGWDSNLPSGTTGPVHACSASNDVLTSTGTENACDGGTAYSCKSFQPQIVNSTFSYGFAGHTNTASTSCCKCFEFTWTSGAGKGKSMIVQAVNAGGITDVDFDLYTPGGGVGGEEACSTQYNTPTTGWGAQYGGVSSDSECDNLPESLRAGCHWRFSWAGGTVNEWTILFNQVNCPSALTDISGCIPPSI